MKASSYLALPSFAFAVLVASSPSSLYAQAAAPAAPATATATPPVNPDAGFVSIFDGKTLAGWEGDAKYWRVENGALVGEITPETVTQQNSFIIWRGGRTADFELKLEYRVSARGNSGINYRSTEVEGVPWAMRGYQLDIDGQDRNRAPLRHSGQNYEERGRTFLARRGETVRIDASAKPLVVASLGESQALAALLKSDDWNEVHIIARGHVLTHIVNGQVMSLVIDDDPANRRAEGLLGVQVHQGPPMKIEYRNIRLKKL